MDSVYPLFRYITNVFQMCTFQIFLKSFTNVFKVSVLVMPVPSVLSKVKCQMTQKFKCQMLKFKRKNSNFKCQILNLIFWIVMGIPHICHMQCRWWWLWYHALLAPPLYHHHQHQKQMSRNLHCFVANSVVSRLTQFMCQFF